MTMSETLYCLGTVKELKKYGNGCTRLVLSINKPYRTEFLQFFVWSYELLKKEDTGDICGIGDDLAVTYFLNDAQNGYPQLISLTSASIDNCPICWNGLEAIETQRMDCFGCSSLPDGSSKTRMREKMTLLANKEEEFKFSKGCRMTFVSKPNGSILNFVVFPSKRLLHPKVKTFIVGEEYTVCGWKDPRKNHFDVIDIY